MIFIWVPVAPPSVLTSAQPVHCAHVTIQISLDTLAKAKMTAMFHLSDLTRLSVDNHDAYDTLVFQVRK